MKKIYTVLALAAVALTASANAVPATQLASKEATMGNVMTPGMLGISQAEVVTRESMLKAPAQPDLNGLYQLGYFSLEADVEDRQYKLLKLEQLNDKEVMVYGLFFEYGVKANYDPSKMCLSFIKQEVAPVGEFSKTEALYLYPRHLQVGADNKITGQIDIDSFKLYYRPNGIQLGESTAFVGSWVYEDQLDLMVFNIPSNLSGTSGYRTGWKYGVVFGFIDDAYPNAPTFVYNESEWDYIGDSKFTDGWFGTAFIPALDPWKVKTMQNKKNKDQYLLVNPYGPGADEAILEYNESKNEPGYIYLDCSNPDLVIVRPNIASGFSSFDMFGAVKPVICTSAESVEYAINETPKDEIIDDAAIFEDPLPVMNDGVITIPNCVFQYPSMDFTNTDGCWADKAGNRVEMTAIIELPTGAVEGIIADAENAPARYFNLQGMEVANPEAGQLVIKKEGSKTTKMIVR